MKKPARVLPLQPTPAADLTDAQLEARALAQGPRRDLEAELPLEELEAILAMPWATEEPRAAAPAPAARITRRRAPLAAMTRRGAELGTIGNPFTHRGADSREQQHKFCRCAKCGLIERCTPRRDFYGEEDQPLLCEDCRGPYGRNDLPKRAHPASAAPPGGGDP